MKNPKHMFNVPMRIDKKIKLAECDICLQRFSWYQAFCPNCGHKNPDIKNWISRGRTTATRDKTNRELK